MRSRFRPRSMMRSEMRRGEGMRTLLLYTAIGAMVIAVIKTRFGDISGEEWALRTLVFAVACGSIYIGDAIKERP